MNFNEQMEAYVAEIRGRIAAYLPEESGFQQTLLEAVNYSMLAGGKKK